MSAFGGKADINQQSSERPLIAISGHLLLYEKFAHSAYSMDANGDGCDKMGDKGDDCLI